MAGTDEALMVRLRNGDREAFATLVERHYRPIRGFLRARLLVAAETDDLAQEVFLRFFESRARFDTTALVRPWLLGIARNLLREHIRLMKRRREVGWTEFCLELETVLPGVGEPQDDALLWLPDCLAALGPSAAEAIDFHYRAGQRLVEIAATLRRSEGAVKLLLHRARQALRDCLQRKRRETERP